MPVTRRIMAKIALITLIILITLITLITTGNQVTRTIRKVQTSRMVSKTIMRVNSLTKAKLTMNSKVAEITHNSLMIPR